VNPALVEALLNERVRDMHARACWSRFTRQARRSRHRSSAYLISAEEGRPGCLQATSLRSA
jgi:hypothetical protein